MNILVYGGTHHLGAHVVADLRAFGHDVAVIDIGEPVVDDDRDAPVERIPMQMIRPSKVADPARARFTFDVSDFDALVFCGIDTLSDADAIDAGDADLAIESVLFGRLLEGGPRAVVLASSASVYAPVAESALLDENAAVSPRTRLGQHAARVEGMAADHARSAGIPLMVLRSSIIVGTKQGVVDDRRVPRAAAMLPGLAVAALSFPTVTLRLDDLEDPSAAPWLRDFVDVADVARAFRLAVESPHGATGGHGILNIGSGTVTGTGEVLRIIEDCAGVGFSQPQRHDSGGAAGAALSYAAADLRLGWAPTASKEALVRGEIDFLRYNALLARKIGLGTRVGHEYLTSFLSAEYLTIVGVLVAWDPTRIVETEGMSIRVSGASYDAEPLPRRGISIPKTPLRVVPYRVRIPIADLEGLSVQNPVRLVFVSRDGWWFDRRLTYSGLRRKPAHRRSRLFSLHDHTSTLYVRQTDANRMYLTVRARNVTDRWSLRAIIRSARWASALVRRPAVLLYEKESSGYEESASVVFEELIDAGREDVRFILDESAMEKVPVQYRGHVVRRFSWLHFYLFFCARTFIGTESVVHAAELRSADRRLMKRVSNPTYRFVFLQHGVMYMVALSSSQRSFFRAGNTLPPGTKIVCSSKREARHFVDLGGFPEQDLYICGLPKLDRAILDPGADTILISPTWQPWEHNTIRTRPTESLYYRMLAEMYDAVPDGLKARTWILPHRLIRDELRDTDLGAYMWPGDSYDEALRGAALLITDYSSISYDAFYRGTNVVFWWKEKDYCMEQYGGHLMLEEHTAFGPVCMDVPSLTAAVAELYGSPQGEEYLARYREIVEFHDGHNTDRLIEMMKRDKVI